MTVGELNIQVGAKLDKLDRDLRRLDGKMNTHSRRTERAWGRAFTRIGTMAAGAFSIQAVVNYSKEAVEMAGKLEGVERAYNRMADPGLMNELKEATRGTVSELELMKSVTTAGAFGIELRSLPHLMEFARRRAKDMGVEVDVLTEKIVRGIGRKSVLILDDLGISASQIKQELGGVAVESASVADLTKAVGEIAKKAYSDFREGELTTAEEMARLNAELQNQKAILGKQLTPAYSEGLAVMSNMVFALGQLTDSSTKWQDKLALLNPSTIGLAVANQRLADEIYRAGDAQRALTADAQKFTSVWSSGLGPIFEAYGGWVEKSNEQVEEAKKLTDAEIKSLMKKAEALQAIRNVQKDINDLSGITSIGEALPVGLPLQDGQLDLRGLTPVNEGLNVELFDANVEIERFLDNQQQVGEALATNTIVSDQFAESVSSIFTNALFAGENFIDVLSRGIEQLLAQLTQMIIKLVIVRGVMAAFGGGIGALAGIGGIPGLATGGIVTGPTLALIGEGAESEAVIPLSKLDAMMQNSGGGYTEVGGRIMNNTIVVSNERGKFTRRRGRGF